MDMTSILMGLLAGLVVGGGVVYLVVSNAMKKRAAGILKEAEVQAEALNTKRKCAIANGRCNRPRRRPSSANNS